MSPSRHLQALLGLAISSVFLSTQPAAQTNTPPSSALALIGGTIYIDPTSQPIRDGVVLVLDGKIAAVGNRRSVRIPDGAQTIDCSGLTVVAGFWNSHVHFLQRKWTDAGTIPAPELARPLQTMLTQYGFTSVFDTWSMWENTRRIRERIESGEIAGPRIRSTGEAMFGRGEAVPPAAWGSLGFIPLERFQMTSVATEDEAVAGSKSLLDRGVDGLKFYAATPGVGSRVVPENAMAAGVKEAHSRGKVVFAHPSTAPALLASVRAGVDVISHTTPQSGPWDAATIARMRQANVAVIPTLKLWNYELRHERVVAGQDRGRAAHLMHLAAAKVRDLHASRPGAGPFVGDADDSTVQPDARCRPTVVEMIVGHWRLGNGRHVMPPGDGLWRKPRDEQARDGGVAIGKVKRERACCCGHPVQERTAAHRGSSWRGAAESPDS